MASAADTLVAAREKLAAGDDQGALSLVEGALKRSPTAEEAVALRVLASRAARARADLALEVEHLEAAEELAATAVAGSLGGTRLQLGLALLRRGDAPRAAKILGEAIPLLEGDEELTKSARSALEDAKVRASGIKSGVLRGPLRSFIPLGASAVGSASRRARARVLGLLEKLQEADPDASADQLLVSFLDIAIEATRADRGFVLLAEPDGLKVRVAHDARGHELIHPQLEVSFSIAHTAAVEGRTITSVRPAEDPRFAGSRSAKRLALKAVCAAPIRYRRESLGVVVLDRRGEKQAEGFDQESELLATEFARGAAGLIWRARRYDAQRRAHEILLEQYARDAERIRGKFKSDDIVGESPAVHRLLRLLEKVASTDVRVLIRGESGTGKELVAQTIHENSARWKKPFVAVNVGALADTVIESELFGNVEGAFTGARGAPGLIRRAAGGTLFLDEIAEASPHLQVALLRFLQEGEVRPVGSNEVVKVDVRVIAATHEDLEGMVATGRFREDLLHRLNAVSVQVPPLRDRVEDIPILARHFAEEAAKDARDPNAVSRLTDDVARSLQKRSWPGNVRELHNAITQLVSVGSLPHAKAGARSGTRRIMLGWQEAPEQIPTLRESERRTIQAAIAAAHGNKSKAAKTLGISRRGLYYLLVDHGIETETFKRGKHDDDEELAPRSVTKPAR